MSGQRHPQTDSIYARPVASVEPFAFDGRVATVFQDMIHRSVPGYATMIETIGRLAGRFAQPGSRCFDLGCSLGAATLAMRRHVHDRDVRIVAVDNSPAMTERAAEHLRAYRSPVPVDLVCADIEDVALRDASVVVLNFTLQFVPVERRPVLLERIRAGLRPGGILVLSEKIRFPDPDQDALNIELHHDFKRANGYSELEISQKRTALENVLIPETLDTHRARLREAGFTSAEPWYQCFNFMSLVAFA